MRIDEVRTPQVAADSGRSGATPESVAFRTALAEQMAKSEMVFSKHALERIDRRDIKVDGSTLDRLSAGVDRAGQKGARTSLVMVDETAFVVSITNRTVITVAGDENLKENVFTNIDSVVLA